MLQLAIMNHILIMLDDLRFRLEEGQNNIQLCLNAYVKDTAYDRYLGKLNSNFHLGRYMYMHCLIYGLKFKVCFFAMGDVISDRISVERIRLYTQDQK